MKNIRFFFLFISIFLYNVIFAKEDVHLEKIKPKEISKPTNKITIKESSSTSVKNNQELLLPEPEETNEALSDSICNEKDNPKELSKRNRTEPSLTPLKHRKIEKDKVLVKKLKKIILINEPNKVSKEINAYAIQPFDTFECDVQNDEYEIQIDNFCIPHQMKLVDQLTPYLRNPITFNNLATIRAIITKHYHSQGYPIIGVSIPTGQNIANGEIYVLILCAKLEEVKVQGACWSSAKRLKEQIRTKPGEVIKNNQMTEDLAWLNENPFRSVDLIYEKGETLSQTNIILDVHERRPLRGYAGYDYTGNVIAGENRWFAGFNMTNLWWLDHQLNFQFMSADRMEKWWGISGNYIIPFHNRHTLKAYGSFISTKPRPLQSSTIAQIFDMNGKNWRVGGRYNILLPTLTNYRHSLIIGYDFKRTNNFLSFSPVLFFKTNIDVSQFLLGYEGRHEIKQGISLLGLTVYMSPGRMTHYNRNRNFRQERTGTTANYVYAKGTIDTIFILPHKLSYSFSSLFQWSSGKLIPSEELSLGGFLTVRGYDENEIISDNGILLKNELRTKAMKYKTFHNSFPGEFQYLIFLDFGYAINVDKSVNSKKYAILASIGPGIRYNVREYLSFRFDYGFQLSDIKNRPFVSKEHSRAHVGLNGSF